MKTNTGVILLAGLAALWYGVWRGVNAVKVVFKTIRIVSVNLSAIVFDLVMSIYNPLFVGVRVDGIVGDVYIMDIPVAVVNQTVNQTIGARRTTNFNIRFEASTNNLSAALLQNIMSGSVETLVVRFVGNVTIQGVKVPIDRTFTYREIVNQ